MQASSSNTISGKAIATAASVSIGGAGAGGNATSTDDTKTRAYVTGNSTIVTDSNGSATSPTSGALEIDAENTGGTVSAECDGGSGGVGSIGVFYANASVGRSTTAYLAAGLTLTVGNLSVTANTQHLVTSNTVAAVIGGLAGGGTNSRPR